MVFDCGMFVFDLCILFVCWHGTYIVVTCPMSCNFTLRMYINTKYKYYTNTNYYPTLAKVGTTGKNMMMMMVMMMMMMTYLPNAPPSSKQDIPAPGNVLKPICTSPFFTENTCNTPSWSPTVTYNDTKKLTKITP